MVSRKQLVTSFSPIRSVVRRFVTKQSHCLLKQPTPAATMPLRFSGVSPHLEIENNQKIPDGEGTSPFMAFCKLIPRSLFAVLAVALFSSNALSQTPARVVQPDNNEVTCSIDDPAFIASTTVTESKPVWESKPVRPTVPAKPTIDVAPSIGSATEGLPKLQPLLLAAIDQRLGSPYHWGSTGPRSFDCSGFVWSIFQAIGVDFERGSARTLFAKFTPPTSDDQYKFGTLVFFNGLTHVGVVADEKGFYHASRHHGVVYATFEGYWGKHIDGFRRVPLPMGRITD